uniref:Uncharacterized protein n=1 Tax=Leersia perrieri TaxID=77586 RepID=A0A0D9VU81_9ORYZ
MGFRTTSISASLLIFALLLSTCTNRFLKAGSAVQKCARQSKILTGFCDDNLPDCAQACKQQGSLCCGFCSSDIPICMCPWPCAEEQQQDRDAASTNVDGDAADASEGNRGVMMARKSLPTNSLAREVYNL